MFNGKMKAVTFSYDDGITQDQRLITLLNKYGLKATFNLNSDLLGTGGGIVREGRTVALVRPRPEEVRAIYEGHEVASHTLTHPLLTEMSDDEIVKQVEGDRLKLSELVGYNVEGFAYPCGGVNYNTRVAEVIKERTGIRYCRTTVSNHSFDLQDNLYEFKPTVYHHEEWDEMFKLAEDFVALTPDEPKIFYIWGHTFEFDINNSWDRFEELCKIISGKDDIFYGTNREVLL